MANVLIERTDLENIAEAIRTKKSSTDTYLVSDMATEILGIFDSYNFLAYTGNGEIRKHVYLTCNDAAPLMEFYSYEEE